MQLTRVENDLIYSNFFAAVDPVRNPADGRIVCNVTLTDPGFYPGCVPVNLFGADSVTTWKGGAVRQARAIEIFGTVNNLF